MSNGSALPPTGVQTPRDRVAVQVAASARSIGIGALIACRTVHAQPIGDLPPAPLHWIWPGMMVLLLLVTLAIAAVCLMLLRREKALREELDRRPVLGRSDDAPTGLSASAASAASAAGLPPTDISIAQEHESFSYTVSHDLRAPIRVVEGFTKILKEDYGRALDRIGNDHLDRVLGAAARMNSMIDAMLALSQLSSQPLARQPVNLSQLAVFVAEELRRQWPDREVSLRIDDDMTVVGDPVLLRMVIENLLGNAWKYTSKTALAEVVFCRDESSPQTFSVCDNGAGFDMRFADRLFGVFQRLHSANDYPGTGVGLASVRRIVRRHGGEIWADSEVNGGARFHFSIKPA
ncbi:MAG: ATP-binding protein [Ideonella sp.]